MTGSWWTAPTLQVSREAFYAAARAHVFVGDDKDAVVYKYLSEEDKSHRERGVKARVRAGYASE